DGELSAGGLTTDERIELQRHRAIIGTALGPIRRLPATDVASDVMRRVAPRPNPLRRAFAAAGHWLWSPRALTLRPAYALAGARTVGPLVSAAARGVALVASLAASVAIVAAPGDASAQEWRASARVGRVTYEGAPAGAAAGSSAVLGLGRTAPNEWFGLSAAIP